MSKVGVVTLYKDNFGSILQAYSTYSYIKSLGNECVLLHSEYSITVFSKIAKIPYHIYNCLVYKDYLTDRLKKRRSNKSNACLISNKTRILMNRFINSNFVIQEVSRDAVDELNNQYDFFITGSDQVWNGYDEFKFLVFADKQKKIAFAPSFGGSIKDYNRKRIRKALEDFRTLSVREETGANIIKELLNRNVVRLADPTLLYSKNEWVEFASNGIIKKNYILIHFLNNPSQLAINIITGFLLKNDVKAYCIGAMYDGLKEIRGIEFLDVDPYDYVSLINNAKCVFTDSFHSTLFSLNLETQFLTFERQYLQGMNESSRILDLLCRVKMNERYIIEKKIPVFTSWNSDEMFNEERKKIRDFLEELFLI